jgi:SAM-dependent MidA family methyltransferase
MGEPEHITVAELGPGRGTLMADAVRAWRTVPAFQKRLSVALVETSTPLRDAQAEALRDIALPLRWHASVDELPQGPLILLANEFLDALPIHQYVRRDGMWRERVVALDARGGFAFAAGKAIHDATLPTAPEGAILETRSRATALIASLAARAAQAPAAALFIDYGHEQRGFGDTLQAVAAHRFVDPFASPGNADLSAQVDFAALERDAVDRGLRAYGPMPQGEFLLKLGLGARSEALLARATPDQRAAIASGAARLVDPAQMGVLFKALVLQSEGLAPPPPFGDI